MTDQSPASEELTRVNFEAEWRAKTDEQLLEAVGCLDDYTADAQRVIQAEMQRRGLAAPPETSVAFEEANAMARLYRRFVSLVVLQWITLLVVVLNPLDRSAVVATAAWAFLFAVVALPITGYKLLKKLGVDSPGRSAVFMYMPGFSLLYLVVLGSFARTWGKRHRVEMGWLGPTSAALHRMSDE